MWKSFNDFILCMNQADEDAARWFAKEAMAREKGRESMIRRVKGKVISNWNKENNLNNMLAWAATPQRDDYWRSVYLQMANNPEVIRPEPKVPEPLVWHDGWRDKAREQLEDIAKAQMEAGVAYRGGFNYKIGV